MALLLSLFSDQEMRGKGVDFQCATSLESSLRSEACSPAEAGVINPCVHCIYHGLCDDDYCAMLLHPLDMNHAPSPRGWRNYGL